MLPFAEQDEFTFLDLGAGTGAASRVILDMYPRSTAILADYSAEMMRAGERQMERFAGRYRYVEFDMSARGEWPAAIPAALAAVVTSMCVHHLPDDLQAKPVRRDLRPPRPGWLVLQLRPGARG